MFYLSESKTADPDYYTQQSYESQSTDKGNHFTIKNQLYSSCPPAQLFRRYQKESFSLKRRLTTSKGTQGINNPRGGRSVPQYKMSGISKHCLLITMLMVSVSIKIHRLTDKIIKLFFFFLLTKKQTSSSRSDTTSSEKNGKRYSKQLIPRSRQAQLF